MTESLPAGRIGPALGASPRWGVAALLVLVAVQLASCGGEAASAPRRAKELVRQLSEESGDRAQAARALGELRFGGDGVVEALSKALADPVMPVRYAAAVALGKIGPTANSTVPALTRALSDSDSLVRVASARALADIGDGTNETVDVLIERILESENDLAASPYLIALESVGHVAQRAVEPLGRALHGERRALAIRGLGAVGPGAGRFIPELMRIVDDAAELKTVRESAVWSLGAMGRAALESIPVLQSRRRELAGVDEAIEAIDSGRRTRTDHR